MEDTRSPDRINRPVPTLRLRHLVARSNQFVIARLPPAWVYWLAMPHEIWHYLAARALGQWARIVPGATLFDSAARWKRIVVLLAPAILGLIIPVAYHLAIQVTAGAGWVVSWPMLFLTFIAWWSGCLGDFIDVWLLVWRRESPVAYRARMQRMLDRYQLKYGS